MKRPTDPKRFLTADESVDVARVVAMAEQLTSGELKVLIVRHCWGRLEDKAARLFHKHGLDRTAGRNAVMIMVVTTNRQLLIHGDEGIHEKVGEGFWDAIRDRLVDGFKAGRVGGALCDAVGELGRAMAEHFPVAEGDVNEIADGVAHDE